MSDRIVPRAGTRITTIDLSNHQAKLQASGRLQFAKPDVVRFLDNTRQTASIVGGCICQPLDGGRRQILDILGPGRLIGPYPVDLRRLLQARLRLARNVVEARAIPSKARSAFAPAIA
jgi:hypothetical protein